MSVEKRAINFLPWREQIYQQQQRYFLSRLFKGFCSVMIVLIGFLAYWAWQEASLVKKNQALKGQIAEMKEKNKQKRHLFLGNEREKALLEKVTDRKMASQKIAYFLAQLGECRWNGVILSTLLFENNQLSLKGKTASLSYLVEVIQQLKAMPMIAELHFLGAKKITGKSVETFVLEMQLK